MTFNEINEIKTAGFVGFKKMSELFMDNSMLPKTKGVYLVLHPLAISPELLEKGTGGYFKGKNPNVSVDELYANWVEKALIVYIGKAGKQGSKATLNSRLKQYLGFGQGRNIGHYGGRFIWQLKNNSDLVVCWKTLPVDDPRTYEANLIKQFVKVFSKRPFANLID